jgi:sugar lactone lactonase YvrE
VADTDPGPDGVAVDPEDGVVYWTSMGLTWTEGYEPDHEGGTLQTASLDGSGVRRIVEPGTTVVPKQLQLDAEHGHLYWADREGRAVWRSQLDGTRPEQLVTGHDINEVVGIALDVESGHVYFSDRIAKRIYRTAMDLPAGQTAADRTDLELVLEVQGAAQPVDLAVHPDERRLYWTDRFNGTVSRAGLDLPAGQTPQDRSDVEVVVDRLNEPIGLALDLENENEKLYYGTLGGRVGQAGLDGSDHRKVTGSGSVTGVTVVHLPPD